MEAPRILGQSGNNSFKFLETLPIGQDSRLYRLP